MKKIVFLFLTVLCCSSLFAQDKNQRLTEEQNSEEFAKEESMPRFPGCEDEENKDARTKCATENMLAFIYKNLKYPEQAKSKKTEGTVIIRFVVDANGEIHEAEVLRGIGDGCDEEAVRVVSEMPTWIPGIQKGKEIDVYFNLPIRFKL